MTVADGGYAGEDEIWLWRVPDTDLRRLLDMEQVLSLSLGTHLTEQLNTITASVRSVPPETYLGMTCDFWRALVVA